VPLWCEIVCTDVYHCYPGAGILLSGCPLLKKSARLDAFFCNLTLSYLQKIRSIVLTLYRYVHKNCEQPCDHFREILDLVEVDLFVDLTFVSAVESSAFTPLLDRDWRKVVAWANKDSAKA